MQNNRKKIIFLDGNYSEGGNDSVDPSEDAGVVIDQSGDAESKKSLPGLPPGSPLPGTVLPPGSSPPGTVSPPGSSSPGTVLPPGSPPSGTVSPPGSSPPGTVSPPGSSLGSRQNGEEGNTDEEEESQDESQEGSQGQEGGDYDYDLLSEGGRSSIDSASVVSSVATNELLSVDPLYIRLTKFLETSNKMEGGSTANIADLLYDVSSSLKSIKVSFQEINSTLQKLAVTKASQ